MENHRSRNATGKGPSAADGPGTERYSAHRTIEILRALILRKIAELSESEKPVPADDVSRLALALARVEGTDRTRIAREQAAGASGIPLIPLNPAESRLSHLIPLNPAESQLVPLNPAIPLIPLNSAESR